MHHVIVESTNNKWFVRLDREEKPTSLMLYNFVGAKFEAHQIPLDNSGEICSWIEKIYPITHVREVFEQIIFDSSYPEALFNESLAELCRIRDQK